MSASSHSAFGVRHSAFSSAFTFIEVLFAVILLGIGFIMIAAVFPVAIQQTSAVSDETQGSAIARDAIKKIQAVADATVAGPNSTNTLFPPTGTAALPQIWAITTASPGDNAMLTNPTGNTGLLAALGADSFFSADHRFGWVGFYRRDSITNPFAQIYVIALENSNFANYLYPVPTAGQTTISGAVPPPVPPNIYGYSPPTVPSIPAQFFYSIAGDGNTTVVLSYSTSTTPPQTLNGTTGAFVLVGAPSGASPAPAGMIGRFFRLGNTAPLPAAITASGTTTYQTFLLLPGSDLSPTDGYTPSATMPAFTANVWVMGAAPLADTIGGYTGPFSGPNQDIGVATGFIRVNTTNN